jgi:diadenosine tetraphosphatase ApaH/serine/threonine PP2A family protein phosphatase
VRPRVVDGIETGSSLLDVSEGNWVINVGSTGQPRDGDPRACYAILDLVTGMYEARRVAYDFKATGDKIRAAELPEVLSSRLALGR